ncbi:MAG: OB-fold nucleic acid binding domain-containing protein, partial [Traorella sp.]
MMKINELKDGTRGKFRFLVNSLTKGVTSKGATYLSFVFQDKTGNIDAKYWSPTNDEVAHLKAGMILEIDGEVLSYNKQLQIKVNAVKIIDRNSVDLNEFIREGDIPRSELKKKITGVIDSFENKTLQTLIIKVMEHYELDFYNYPAAAKIHHDFVGGLATHVWGMIQLA